jgi:hypothetical protein
MPFVELEPPPSAMNALPRNGAADVPSGTGYLLIGPLVIPIALNFFGDQISEAFFWLIGWINAHVSSVMFAVLFAAVAIVISTLLYLLRVKNRKLYAVLEMAFGISASVFAANGFYPPSTHETQFRNFVAAVGGIYIIIRGLDNWFYKSPDFASEKV